MPFDDRLKRIQNKISNEIKEKQKQQEREKEILLQRHNKLQEYIFRREQELRASDSFNIVIGYASNTELRQALECYWRKYGVIDLGSKRVRKGMFGYEYKKQYKRTVFKIDQEIIFPGHARFVSDKLNHKIEFKPTFIAEGQLNILIRLSIPIPYDNERIDSLINLGIYSLANGIIKFGLVTRKYFDNDNIDGPNPPRFSKTLYANFENLLDAIAESIVNNDPFPISEWSSKWRLTKNTDIDGKLLT